MHRIASVCVMGVTAWFLIATSQAPCQSTAETVTVTSRTTCGPDTIVTVAVDSSCHVTVLGGPDAGLASSGEIFLSPRGTLVQQKISLYSVLDAGDDAGFVPSESCGLAPFDAGTGWAVNCLTTLCGGGADAGCDLSCSGALTK